MNPNPFEFGNSQKIWPLLCVQHATDSSLPSRVFIIIEFVLPNQEILSYCFGFNL